jgi:hypothetical protein
VREEKTYAGAVGEGVSVLGHGAVVRRSVSVARHDDDDLMEIGGLFIVLCVWLREL